MSIKSKGVLLIEDGTPTNCELHTAVMNLPNGEYKFFVLDSKPNPILPQIKYFMGIVLKTIAESLPDCVTAQDVKLKEPDKVRVLYNFFTEKFLEPKVHTVFGEAHVSKDIKNLNASEFENFIGKVIDYSKSELGIDIELRADLKNANASEPFVGAYDNQWG